VFKGLLRGGRERGGEKKGRGMKGKEEGRESSYK